MINSHPRYADLTICEAKTSCLCHQIELQYLSVDNDFLGIHSNGKLYDEKFGLSYLSSVSRPYQSFCKLLCKVTTTNELTWSTRSLYVVAPMV